MTLLKKNEDAKPSIKPARTSQMRRSLLSLIVVYTFPLTLLLATGIQRQVPPQFLLRDPLAIVDAPAYFGFISNIGALLWCATAAICLFSFVLLESSARQKEAFFLLQAGVLTLLLLIDDFFMLHDKVLPEWIENSENILYSLYAAMLFWLLIRFRKVLLETNVLILVLALGFLVASSAADLVFQTLDIEEFLTESRKILLEDGLKLFGITTWFWYFSTTCLHQLQKLFPGQHLEQ